MRITVADVDVHFVEHGQGLAVLALHGAGVDHREIEAWLELILGDQDGYRRIYPDLPGMGRTPAAEQLTSNDDVVDLLVGFIDRMAAEEPFLVVGQSYGAYLARAVLAQRRDRAIGLALVCPVGEPSRDVPEQKAVRVEDNAYDLLAADQATGFDNYFVVRTPATAQRYRDAVAPGVALVDETGLGRIFAQWTFRSRPEDNGPCPYPTLILAGRQDSAAGYASAGDLLPDYPHATYAVLDGAGHALPHEQPDLVAGFINDWITRAARRPRPGAGEINWSAGGHRGSAGPRPGQYPGCH